MKKETKNQRLKIPTPIPLAFFVCPFPTGCKNCHRRECLQEKSLCLLTVPLEFTLPQFGVLRISCGFAFDGASISRWLWPIFGHPFSPRLLRAALLHDALYSSGILDRKRCDSLFFWQLTTKEGVTFWKAKLMYYGVRIFGKKHYLRDGEGGPHRGEVTLHPGCEWEEN